MKASARLIKAFIALVVSCVLCIAVCLAWFAQNEKVDANGMQTEVRDNNIHNFTVTAYDLEANDSGGYNITGEHAKTNNGVEMTAYGNDLNTGLRNQTALLLEFSYNCSDKTFRVQAECNKNFSFAEAVTPTGDTFKSYLSDAVELFVHDGITVTKTGDGKVIGGTVTVNSKSLMFIEENDVTDADGNVNTEITKHDVLIADKIAAGTGTVYCIIDYSEVNIERLYSKAADNGGTISSKINFSFVTAGERDIVFYMEEDRN